MVQLKCDRKIEWVAIWGWIGTHYSGFSAKVLDEWRRWRWFQPRTNFSKMLDQPFNHHTPHSIHLQEKIFNFQFQWSLKCCLLTSLCCHRRSSYRWQHLETPWCCCILTCWHLSFTVGSDGKVLINGNFPLQSFSFLIPHSNKIFYPCWQKKRCWCISANISWTFGCQSVAIWNSVLSFLEFPPLSC